LNHVGILKRSWEITWRYKALWILGLFAGAAGGSSSFRSFGSNSSSSSNSQFPQFANAQSFWDYVQPYLPLAIAGIAILTLVGFALWIISVAATGGLVWLSNEAADGREVRAGRGWAAGFHYWGRTFLIGLLLALPVLLVVVVIGALVAAAIAGGVVAFNSNMSGAGAGAILAICGIVALALIVLIPLAVIVSLLQQLAVRHGVLDDMTAGSAINASWTDLRGRTKDVLVMWVMLIAVGIVYSIVLGIVAIAVIAPGALLVYAGAWPVAVVLGFVVAVVLLVPTAVFNTLFSTAWTVFFRQLTGREQIAAPARPAYAAGYPAPPAPAGMYPPPPPAPPAPEDAPAPPPAE
jgi:hypothetical protein